MAAGTVICGTTPPLAPLAPSAVRSSALCGAAAAHSHHHFRPSCAGESDSGFFSASSPSSSSLKTNGSALPLRVLNTSSLSNRALTSSLSNRALTRQLRLAPYPVANAQDDLKSFAAPEKILSYAGFSLPPLSDHRSKGQRRSTVQLRAAAEGEERETNRRGSASTGSASDGSDIELLEERLQLGRRARRRAKKGGKGGSEKNISRANSVKAVGEETTNDDTFAKVRDFLWGEKGVLYWLNRSSYIAIFLVIGGWIFFRFIGPQLGLYELQDDLLSPS